MTSFSIPEVSRILQHAIHPSFLLAGKKRPHVYQKRHMAATPFLCPRDYRSEARRDMEKWQRK